MPSRWPSPFAQTLLLSSLLAGCQTTATTATKPGSFCSVYKPITYSTRSDPRETVAQIVPTNLIYRRLCS